MPFALIEGKIVEGDIAPSLLPMIGERLFEPKNNPKPQWRLKPSIIFHTYKQADDAWKEMVKFMKERGRQFPIEWGVDLS